MIGGNMNQAVKEDRFIKGWEFAIGVGSAVGFIVFTSFATFQTKESSAQDFGNIKSSIELRAGFRDLQMKAIETKLDRIDEKLDAMSEKLKNK
jgi:hypothetical protein